MITEIREFATRRAEELEDEAELTASEWGMQIQRSDVDTAREIAMLRPALSARDRLHLAVMRANGVKQVLTFDDGFSTHPGVTRLP